MDSTQPFIIIKNQRRTKHINPEYQPAKNKRVPLGTIDPNTRSTGGVISGHQNYQKGSVNADILHRYSQCGNKFANQEMQFYKAFQPSFMPGSNFGMVMLREDADNFMEAESSNQRLRRIPTPNQQQLINYEEFEL